MRSFTEKNCTRSKVPNLLALTNPFLSVSRYRGLSFQLVCFLGFLWVESREIILYICRSNRSLILSLLSLVTIITVAFPLCAGKVIISFSKLRFMGTILAFESILFDSFAFWRLHAVSLLIFLLTSAVDLTMLDSMLELPSSTDRESLQFSIRN